MKLIKVVGSSMQPHYRDGDYVLVSPYHASAPRVGDDVVCRHPSIGVVIKRIAKVSERQIFFQAVNRLGMSPEALGWVSRKAIIGRVRKRIAKPL
ncbi:MAG: S24 family peptidase [Pseudomonadota bacterium]